VVDAQTAKNAGVEFVAVLTGVTPEADINKYEPCAVITDLRLLPALII
jgi:phosphoglycolate phosphatase